MKRQGDRQVQEEDEKAGGLINEFMSLKRTKHTLQNSVDFTISLS